jgi:hypothetical protein
MVFALREETAEPVDESSLRATPRCKVKVEMSPYDLGKARITFRVA